MFWPEKVKARRWNGGLLIGAVAWATAHFYSEELGAFDNGTVAGIGAEVKTSHVNTQIRSEK